MQRWLDRCIVQKFVFLADDARVFGQPVSRLTRSEAGGLLVSHGGVAGEVVREVINLEKLVDGGYERVVGPGYAGNVGPEDQFDDVQEVLVLAGEQKSQKIVGMRCDGGCRR
ncbi:hypothetical protein D9M72_504560 [compost metagenome]